MIMFFRSMRMAMTSQNEEPGKVRGKTQAPNYKNELWIANFWRVDKTRDSFENNREAKGY
jgi:hypothetical protein